MHSCAVNRTHRLGIGWTSDRQLPKTALADPGASGGVNTQR